MSSHQPILITGTHRSGTTWVGQTLRRAPRVGYIHEPWHQNHPPGICSAEFWGPYIYVNERRAHKFQQPVQNMLAFQYDWRAQLRAKRPRNFLKTADEWLQFTRNRWLGYRPLVKDPLALLSAEWLAQTFDMQVVVLIRHPAAFVSSVKRMGWDNFHFGVFKQPALLQDGLHPYAAEVAAYETGEPDVIDQSILVWRILNHVIAGYRERHPDWLYVRHEALALAPEDGFAALCNSLSLPMGDGMRRYIRKTTRAASGGEVADNAFLQLERDSAAVIKTWQQRLTPAEIARIKAQTADVWPHFYSADDW